VNSQSLAFQFVAPVGIAVVSVTALAWYLTWLSADSMASLMMMPLTMLGPLEVGGFFAMMTTMMVAMMLPAALPMIVSYRRMVKEKRGFDLRTREARSLSFVAPYLLVWGGFGVASLSGILILGIMGAMSGILALAPGVALLAAGGYQFTRAKEACLEECQTPFSFMLRHWRDGNLGAVRMGLSHASYCIGCCWLFMLVLFLTGAMSLFWMGGVSLIIFVEKVGFKRTLVSRMIGVILLLLGSVVAVQAIAMP
jgi:predicted metal-binding membrane protein